MSIKTHKLAIMASILVVAVSLLSVFLLKDNQRSHDTIALSKAVTQSPSLIEPKNPEDPAEKLKRFEAWGDKFDSMDKAKEKLEYTPMLPSDTKGRKLAAIYVEKNSTPEAREVQVLYEGDFIFSASPTPSTEDQEIQHFKQVVNQPGSTFPNYVTIHGHPGCGTGPNITEGPFGKHQNPGSLVWWEDGITYSVIAPGVELNDLINIAESTKLQ